MLAGCGTSTSALAQEPAASEPAAIAVSEITTNHPVVELEEDAVYTLQYTIHPVNATDKSVRVDLTNAQGIVEAIVDEFNTVILVGRNAGTGVVSIITSNDKFVSYSVSVWSKYREAEEPLVYKAEDVVKYYNESGSPYGYVSYTEEPDYVGWQTYYDCGPETDTSWTTLIEPIRDARQYLPLKGLVESGFLMHLGDGYLEATEDTDAYYRSVEVSSNMFAAVSLFSYIENGHLILNICIYDGRNKLYV